MSKQKKIAVIDCETDPFGFGVFPVKPFLWCWYDGKRHHFFNDTVDLIDFIDTLKGYIVYAHNGGKFDFHFLVDYAQEQDITIISGRIASFRIGNTELRDSYCLLPQPLADYKKQKFDYSLCLESKRSLPGNEQAIRDYCLSDCVNLHEWLLSFFEEYPRKLTIASTAMTVWSRMADVNVPSTAPAFFEYMRLYYHGGRTECYQSGRVDGEIKVYDINSAYPHAMLSNHAWGEYFIKLSSLDGLSDGDIATTLICVECESSGYFPFFDKGLKFFNDGVVRKFHITGHEFLVVRPLLKSGYKVHSVVVFEQYISFDSYVNHFYQLKSNAKTTHERLHAKLFLNSLYGKFGANPDNYNVFRMVQAGDTVDDMDFNSLLTEQTALFSAPIDEDDKHFYNVATSASIAGYVRAQMLKFLLQARAQGDRVLYCDTDSIFLMGKGFDTSSDIGEWKLEGTYSVGYFAGKKIYALKKGQDVKMACKGVKPDFNSIKKIALGGSVKFDDMVVFGSRGQQKIHRTIKSTLS